MGDDDPQLAKLAMRVRFPSPALRIDQAPHVVDVHDLHASQIASGLPVLSAHVVVEDSCFQDGHAPQILDQLQTCIAEHFPVSVEHSTFQLEVPAHAAHELSAHH